MLNSRFALITHMHNCDHCSLKILSNNCKSSSYHHDSSVRLLISLRLAEAR